MVTQTQTCTPVSDVRREEDRGRHPYPTHHPPEEIQPLLQMEELKEEMAEIEEDAGVEGGDVPGEVEEAEDDRNQNGNDRSVGRSARSGPVLVEVVEDPTHRGNPAVWIGPILRRSRRGSTRSTSQWTNSGEVLHCW